MSKCLNSYIDHEAWEITDFEKAIAEVGALRASKTPIPFETLKNQIQELRICESYDLKKQEVLTQCLNPHFIKRAVLGFQQISNRNRQRKQQRRNEDPERLTIGTEQKAEDIRAKRELQKKAKEWHDKAT